MGKKYLNTKGGTLEDSILSIWQNAAEELDPVNKKAVKKKFKNRKDKDLDNDGDVDDSDEYLHKRRKAVSKAVDETAPVGRPNVARMNVEPSKKLKTDQGKPTAVKIEPDAKPKKNEGAMKRGKDMDTFKPKPKTESYEIGTDEYRKHTQEVTPGQEIKKYGEFKVQSMREAMHKVWGISEKKLDKEDKDVVKSNKAMTGGKVAKVDMKPSIEDK